MFHGWSCGCIVSQQQGRVRICQTHKAEKADGNGGGFNGLKGAGTKAYPANGEMVANWSGK